MEKSLLRSENSSPDYSQQIVGFHLNDGLERPLFDLKWPIDKRLLYLKWLADGSGFIVTKATQDKSQVYHLSYPGGVLTSITNDLNDYLGVSLTENSESIVTTQRFINPAIWGASSTEPDAAIQLTSGSAIDDGDLGLSWTPEGKIIYSSREPTGTYQLWLIKPDGTNRKRITSGEPGKLFPVASADGRYIVYVSTNKVEIWRIDTDGGNPKLLSRTKAVYPRFSPDSNWILCSSYRGEKEKLLKLSLDGSKETTLASHKLIYAASISPDGSQIAYLYNDPRRLAE